MTNDDNPDAVDPTVGGGATPGQPADAEAMCDPRVRSLIELYAALVGGRSRYLADDLIELEIPQAEQAFFLADGAREAPSRVRLAFSLNALEQDPDAEMAVLGSSIFEHVIEAIRTRGCRVIRGEIKVGDLEGFASDHQTLPVSRCRVSAPDTDMKLHPVGSLLARVVLRSGAEVQEQLVTSSVFDLATGTRVPEKLDSLCHQLESEITASARTQSSSDSQTASMLPPEKLITGILKDIEGRMSSAIAEYERLAEQSLGAELKRLNGYYDRLIDEDPNSTADSRATVNAERERRTAEEKRRHEVRASAHPIQLEEWSVPVERVRWRLETESGKKAEVASLRYLAGDKHWIAKCPTCGREPESMSVCLENHAICDACASVCNVCGEVFCSDHGIASCHVDNEPACREHSAMCGICGRRHCTKHQDTCEDGDHIVCAACLVACEVCGRSTCTEHGTHTGEDAPRGSRWLCSRCVVFCEGGTNEPVGLDEVTECASCDRYVCERHQSVCAVDGKVHCSRHLRRTDQSRRLVCEGHSATCDHEPGAILATDEVTECVMCGKSVCDRHAGICVVHDQLFCLEHLKPLLDTQGDMACTEHYSMCHVDGSTYSLAGTSLCPVCDKPTCASHLMRCDSCGRTVCTSDIVRGEPCVTCQKLDETYDIGDDVIAASMSANDGQPMKVKGWRMSRDAHHKVIEADLGWTRKVVFTVRHGDSKADTVVKRSVMGSRVVRYGTGIDRRHGSNLNHAERTETGTGE